MNLLLATYCDMIVGTKTGNWQGNASVSKFLYLISIIEAIDYQNLTKNEIYIEDTSLRKRFGQLYEQYYGNSKGYGAQFYGGFSPASGYQPAFRFSGGGLAVFSGSTDWLGLQWCLPAAGLSVSG